MVAAKREKQKQKYKHRTIAYNSSMQYQHGIFTTSKTVIYHYIITLLVLHLLWQLAQFNPKTVAEASECNSSRKFKAELLLATFNNFLLVELNNFMKSLFITKSRDDICDLIGQIDNFLLLIISIYSVPNIVEIGQHMYALQ